MTDKPAYEELEQQVRDLRKQNDSLRKHYHVVVDNSMDAILLTAPDGNVFFANPAACNLFGMTQQEIIDGGRMAVIDAEDPRLSKALEERERTGKFIDELNYKKKDGMIFPGEVSSAVFRDAEGRMLTSMIIRDLTERKRLEKALSLSEDQYRTIVEGVPDLLYSYSTIRGGIYYSPQVHSVLGYPSSYLLQNPHLWHDSIHPEDLNRVDTAVSEFKDGKPFELEYRIRDAKGNWLWFLDRSVGRTYHNGEVIIAGVATDISKHKMADEELKQSEEIFRVAFEHAPVGMCLVNPDGRFMSVNSRFCHMLGYFENELLSKSFQDITHPDDLDTSNEWVRKLLAGETTFPDIEKRYIHKEGHIVWGTVHASLLRNMEGSPRFFVTYVQDITERKRTEEQRDKLQAQLSNAMEIAHLAHWEYDIANDLFTFNDHFYKIFRTTAEHVGGYTMSSAEYAKRFVHPDDLFVVGEETRKAIETTDPHFTRQIEHRMLYADGTVGHITVRFFIVKDAQGRTVKTYGVNQDITERKRIEDELLRAQKLESVGVLAGGIAHDFNNILTTILGNVSMAKQGVSPEDEEFDLLNEAETASIRAQTLTKQLLTFAKGGTPVKETASIKDILKESLSFVLRGSKSGCEFSIAEDLWSVDVDVGQISQVINDIAINANQAMPEGGIIQVVADNLIIEDRHGLHLKQGKYIRITITDHGAGIAEEHFSKIFDPYFTTKHAGSGLGLATTFSIIKRHDGHITVESKLGEGTTFHIYLPASQKAVPEKEEVSLIKGRGKILVMDDEASLRKIVGRMLHKLGYESEFAGDGAEAIEMYKKARESQKPYDAVILDLTIPGGMGGKEAIEKLLEIDPEVKAIVSSGYSDDPVLANFQEYGFKGMMPKPFETRSLSKVLHEVLKGEKLNI